MKTSHEIVSTRSHGLKHLDKAVALIGRKAVIDKIAAIIAEFANIPTMPLIFGWAYRNAIIEILDPKWDMSLPFNSDEAFTVDEIVYLESFGMKNNTAHYGPRKSGPPLADAMVLNSPTNEFVPYPLGTIRGPFTCGVANEAHGGVQFLVKAVCGWVPFIEKGHTTGEAKARARAEEYVALMKANQ